MKQAENKSLIKRIVKAKWVYVALLPTMLFLAIFMVYPVYQAVTKSFFNWKMNNYNNPNFIGIENYKDILTDNMFWKSCGILLVFIAWGFITTMIVAVPVTYLVYRLGEKRMGKFVQTAFVIPMMVPGMVLTLFWKFFYEPNFGMLNNILKMLGQEQLAHIWLGEQATALPALLFVGFPWVSGFGFLVLLAGFQGIDVSLHEAARVDGINSWQIFTQIDFPLILPQLKILIILGMINGIQQFQNQMILTKGGPNYATTVPGLMMYDNAFKYGKLGYASAIGVILFLVILVFTVFANTKINRDDV